MKTLRFLCLLLPFSVFADQSLDVNRMAMYQELCAKEPDPLKRHRYCHVFEQKEKASPVVHGFEKEMSVA